MDWQEISRFEQDVETDINSRCLFPASWGFAMAAVTVGAAEDERYHRLNMLRQLVRALPEDPSWRQIKETYQALVDDSDACGYYLPPLTAVWKHEPRGIYEALQIKRLEFDVWRRTR